MSLNQSRVERNDSSYYRKSGRSGSSSQPRNFSGGSGKGGGTAPPPSSTNSSLSSNRSFKRSSNAQGGQSRVSGASLNSNSNSAYAARALQNGSHFRPAVRGTADASTKGINVKPTMDVSMQESAQAVPKVPSSQPVAVNFDSESPATPAKGDASRTFPLQFGSISPGVMNGMQIPARTSSAPPNLDEQQHDQARHDSLRVVPQFPIPPIPKQQIPRNDKEQTNASDSHQMSKAKRDAQVSSVPPVTHTQKASIHPVHGVSMPVPFHQPQIPVQFGPNPQIQSQGMAATSLPIPMPLPLTMGNGPQLQQPMFVSSLPPHPMQTQGIMHQGQNLNFTSQMGPQLPPQVGNLGVSIGSQFTQQQPGKFAPTRKPVKITHPDTHEELRLDKRADAHVEGGSSGSRSQPNVPQSQPPTSVPPAHHYYPSSYNHNPLFFSATNSVPLTSTQLNPGSQVPRLSYPVNQSPQTTPFMNPAAHNSYPSKNSTPSHGIPEPSSSEHSHDVHNRIPVVASAPVQVTVRPATSSHIEKNVDASLVISTPYIEKGASAKLSQQCREASSIHLPKDSETWPDISSHQLNPSLKPTSTSLPVTGNQPATASPSYVEGTVPNSLSPRAHLDESALTVNGTENRKETINKFDSNEDQQKKQMKKGHSQPHEQVPVGTAESLTVETTSASLNSSSGIVESPKEALPPLSFATSDVPEFRTDSYNPDFTSEASNMVGPPAIFDSSYGDHHVSKNHPQDETLEAKHGGKMVNECPKDKNRSETSNESVSSIFSDVVNETGPNSLINAAVNSHEVELLQNVEKDFKEPVGHCKRDNVGVDDSVISTSVVLNSDKPSPSDAFRSDSLDSRQAVVPSVSGPTLKREGEDDSEDVNARTIPVLAVNSKDKLAAELSRSKSVGARGKKKKKDILQKADAAGTTSDLYIAYKGPEAKKETVDTSESTASASSIGSKQESIDAIQDDDLSSEKGDQSKNEPEDWEDAAEISTPALESGDDEKQVRGGMKQRGEYGYGLMARKYSRDFLLKFCDQCTELPEGFEITPDIAEALMVSKVNASRESFLSPGRNIDRQSGARSDRRGSGIGDDDKRSKLPSSLASGRDPRMDGYAGNLRPGQGGNYGVLRNHPRAQIPAHYSGGILSGPVHSLGPQGSVQRNNSDSDRWQRATGFLKGLMPSPQTPLQVMHKAEKKYQVGKVADEEEAKQRQLKAILNKLTPQNFDKLFEQVKEVNIDSAATLTSVIAQIFDKALMEPTFCEMYADFCYRLAGELPDFSEDNEKITFKRLLLNKCQEEFERGEREQEEADRADISEVMQSEEEREEKRIKARRRMLGNIRLIGELYKKKMLTERIMHECIKKLLGQYQNPDEENIEALCKLMSTIGEIIDHPKAKEHMDAYFDVMAKLSNNMKLSSRVRFMLKDAIDLRKNKWQQRRKIEGPKKIEEVHRDAAQERQVQAGRLTRGPSMNASVRNRQTMDFGARGSHMVPSASAQMGSFRGLPTQLRGHGIQDVRMDDRHSFDNRTLSVPLPHRPIGEDTITLGPQGGLARGMSIRGQPSNPNSPLPEASSPGDSRRVATGLNGYSSVQDRTVFGSREDLMPRYPSDRFGAPSDMVSVQDRNMSYGNRDIRNADLFERSLPSSPTTRGQAPLVSHNVPSDRVWPEERLRDMSMAAIKEFYSAKDVKEVALCVKDLNAPSFYPTMISIWINDSFERKDMERDLLANLLINLSTSRESMLSQDHIMKGVEDVLTTLEDAVNDAPKAGEFLGRILAKIILENVIQFTEIGQLIYDGGEEQGRLVKVGLAAEVVGTILETIKSSEKGESILNEIRCSSSLKLDKFRPPDFKRPLRLDKFL